MWKRKKTRGFVSPAGRSWESSKKPDFVPWRGDITCMLVADGKHSGRSETFIGIHISVIELQNVEGNELI